MPSIEFVQLGEKLTRSTELKTDTEANVDIVRLTGRCYQGPIRVGDVFTELMNPSETYEVALRVDSLRSYDNEVPEIYPSESAQISLSGRGSDRLAIGVVLRG